MSLKVPWKSSKGWVIPLPPDLYLRWELSLRGGHARQRRSASLPSDLLYNIRSPTSVTFLRCPLSPTLYTHRSIPTHLSPARPLTTSRATVLVAGSG